MALAVYLLCSLTTAMCSALLIRGYLRNGVRLLFWASLCFLALALENVIVILDYYVVPGIDLSPLRMGIPLAGLMALLYGLLWESR